MPKLDGELAFDGMLLSRIRPADAEALNAAVSESFDELNAWMEWAQQPQSVEDTRAFCCRSETEFDADGEYSWIMRPTDGDRVLGCIGVPDVDWTVPRFELGYWCRTSDVGRGYVSAATRGLTRYLFSMHQVVRVELHMDGRNARSEAVAKRLGFSREGKLKHHMRANDESLRDTLIYALTSIDDLR